SVRRVRQQRDRPRALDRRLELALVQRAGARDAPRQDLAALGDEALQQLDVLPVDVLELLRAELADLAPADEEFLARPALAVPPLRVAAARASRTGSHSHDCGLLSAPTPSWAPGSAALVAVPASAGGAGCEGGRGGLFSAFALSRSAILPARLSSSSTRTARCRRIWSERPMRRSASATAAG